MTTPSPNSSGQTRRFHFPWTDFSIAMAVVWMLFLTFGAPEPSPATPQEPQAAGFHNLIEVGLLHGLQISVHPSISPVVWKRRELMAQALDSDG